MGGDIHRASASVSIGQILRRTSLQLLGVSPALVCCIGNQFLPNLLCCSTATIMAQQ